MPTPSAALTDDFRKEPAYPPDWLFTGANWSGVGDLEAYRGLERRLAREHLIALAYLRLHERLGFALLTADMQARWKKTYQDNLAINQRTLALVARLASLLEPYGRILLLDDIASLCTVHEDAGARACDSLSLLVTPEALAAAGERLGQEGMQVLLRSSGRLVVEARTSAQESVRCELYTYLAGQYWAIDAGLVRQRAVAPSPARPVLQSPVPPLEFIAAIDLHAQHDPSQPQVPSVVRPLERADASTLEQVLGVPHLRVPAPHDQLLLAIASDLDHAHVPGLRCWEQARMTQLPGFDWKALAEAARTYGLALGVERRLEHLAQAWQAHVPAGQLPLAGGASLARRRLASKPALSEEEGNILRAGMRWPTPASLQAQAPRQGGLMAAFLARWKALEGTPEPP